MQAPIRYMVVVLALAFVGACGKSEPKAKPEPAKTAEKPEAKPAADAPAPEPDKDAGESPKAEADASGASEPEIPAEPVEGPLTKANLEQAYVAIYCAHRKQEVDKLLTIYKRYGFEDPKAWTKAWTEAATDKAWIAAITKKAVDTCP